MINQRIKLIRKNLNLNQEEFGLKLGITKSSVSRLESGSINLTDQLAKLICIEFNVNENWLKTGEGQMFNELTREEAITEYIAGLVSDNSKDRDFEKRFFRAMASLSKEQWLVVQEIMDKMVEDNEKS